MQVAGRHEPWPVFTGVGSNLPTIKFVFHSHSPGTPLYEHTIKKCLRQSIPAKLTMHED
jgi:hypothetical protein